MFSVWVGLNLTSACWAENSADADQAWQVILEQAQGPGTHFKNQKEALSSAREHLDKQETALRDFYARFPADSRYYSARIRLSSVLRAKAKLAHNPAIQDEGARILTELESDPAIPNPVKADAAFARISQQMEDMAAHADATSSDALAQEVRRFEGTFHGDRRTAGLFAELATLYDTNPEEKRRLLLLAQDRTPDEALRARINDDLTRLNLLGKPLDFRFQPVGSGPAFDLSTRRGHAVVLLFWASWSGPALRELAALIQISALFSGKPVDFLTVSLDEDRAYLASTMKATDLRWPVQCDTLGWKGELVRTIGLNALPTVFILDRRGVLISLNARGAEREEIERALAP